MTDALIERHGKEAYTKFSNAVVAVCGLGGLGSNIAISLARAGIGKLILIDFDKVDLSNLNRQQYKVSQIGMYKTNALSENIKEIAPYTEIKSYTEKLTEENGKNLLLDADIICEAFDNAENKAMLVDIFAEYMPQKYLVAASGMAGIHSPNSIKTRQLTKHIYICGDGISDVSTENSLYSTGAMLCAAHQSQTVLRILLNKFDL